MIVYRIAVNKNLFVEKYINSLMIFIINAKLCLAITFSGIAITGRGL